MPTHRTIWLVHGFNVADGGAGTVGRLTPYLQAAGFTVKPFRYGWRGLLGVRFGNGGIARLLNDAMNPGDLAIGHSNGCAIIHRAAKNYGAPFGPIAYLNPALDRDALLPPQIPHLAVWHSPSDRPVAWARWLPFHPWGDMGADGYRGYYDPRITNHNKQTDYPLSSRTHSDVFSPALLPTFAPLIIESLLNALPSP